MANWNEFLTDVQEIAERPSIQIERETRLVQELDLDSLALIELVVAMVDKYGLSIPDGLDAERWEHLTAGQLFDAVQVGSLA